MSDRLPFPTQAQIARAIKAVEAVGMIVSAVRIEPTGGIVVFSDKVSGVASVLPPGDNEPNDFD